MTCKSTRALLWLALALLVALSGPVRADTEWIPRFDPEVRVHLVPPHFSPPGMSGAALRDLNDVLKGLRFPLYVVIMQHLPGTGSPERRGQAATDNLAAAWASQGVDLGVSSYFVLTFQPRQYSFLVGTRWKAELGLEGETLDPFLRHFLARVRGTPSDPINGIRDLARAFDTHVTRETNPEVIARRRAESNRNKAIRLRQELRGLLASPPEHLPWEVGPHQETLTELGAILERPREALAEMDLTPLETRVTDLRESVQASMAAARELKERRSRAESLLASIVRDAQRALDGDYAPSDTTQYTAAITRARDALKAEDVTQIEAAIASLREAVTPLHAHVASAQAEAARRERLLLLLALALGAGLAITLLVLLHRRRRRQEALAALLPELATWQDKLRNAAGRYVEFYGRRDAIIGLLDMKGRTAALFAEVTSEVDAIYTAVRAMEAHVDACRDAAEGAGPFDFKRVEAALARFQAPFEFDTGELNPDDLFGPPTRVVAVSPRTLEAELDRRFRASVDGWSRLEEVAELRFSDAMTLFPHDALDTLLAHCDAADVPHAWVADHPLFGDETEDARIYAEADVLRWEDPVAYAERIESLRATETAIIARTEELLAARDRVARARARRPALPDTPAVREALVLDPSDDPAPIARQAELAWARLLARLAAPPAPPVETAPVLAFAEEVLALFAETGARVEAAQEALGAAASLLSKAVPEAVAGVRDHLGAVSENARAAARVHAELQADGFLEAASDLIGHASRQLEEGRSALSARRLVVAMRHGRASLSTLAAAESTLAQTTRYLDDLETIRQHYLSRLAAMDGIRSQRERVIRGCGETPALTPFQGPDLSQPQNYALASRSLEAVLDAWEAAERGARQRQQERERLRQAAIAEAAREAARRRAASVSSSWSSSSSRSSFSSSSRSSSFSSSSSSRSSSWGGSSRSSSRSGGW